MPERPRPTQQAGATIADSSRHKTSGRRPAAAKRVAAVAPELIAPTNPVSAVSDPTNWPACRAPRTNRSEFVMSPTFDNCSKLVPTPLRTSCSTAAST